MSGSMPSRTRPLRPNSTFTLPVSSDAGGQFSPEFFLAEGEPYDRSDLATNAEGKPTSVWSAIHMMPKKDFRRMAKDVFELETRADQDLLMAEGVLEKIRETNTCTNLSSPVEVWIDEKGDHRIKVWL